MISGYEKAWTQFLDMWMTMFNKKALKTMKLAFKSGYEQALKDRGFDVKYEEVHFSDIERLKIK